MEILLATRTLFDDVVAVEGVVVSIVAVIINCMDSGAVGIAAGGIEDIRVAFVGIPASGTYPLAVLKFVRAMRGTTAITLAITVVDHRRKRWFVKFIACW